MANIQGPPYKLIPIAGVGTTEPWLARTFLGPLDMMAGLPFDTQRAEDFKAALYAMFEELTYSFSALSKVRELVQAGSSVPLFDLNKEYDATYDHLWRAYKDRLQVITTLLGYDIGFLYKTDANFETGASTFAASHPKVNQGFIEMLRGDRQAWQNTLADFRNHQRHTSENEQRRARLFRLDAAQSFFTNGWQAIEEILVILIAALLKAPFIIIEIPEVERNSANPQRFRLSLDLSIPATA